MALEGVRGCGGDTSPSTHSTRSQAHPAPRAGSCLRPPRLVATLGWEQEGWQGRQSLPVLSWPCWCWGKLGCVAVLEPGLGPRLHPVVQASGQCWVLLGDLAAGAGLCVFSPQVLSGWTREYLLQRGKINVITMPSGYI